MLELQWWNTNQAWHWPADVVRHTMHTHNVEGMVVLLNLHCHPVV